jgi:hypothetical protein
MTKLTVERRDQENLTPVIGGVAMMTPNIGEDYWSHRVCVAEGQAIIAFPKFMTIGIGFAVETDWNTNLPWTCEAQQIFDHIAHNKGYDGIADEDCLRAIQMLQEAIREDGGNEKWREG